MRLNGYPAPRYEVLFDEEAHRYSVPGALHPVPFITGIIGEVERGFTHTASPERLEAARLRGTYVHGCAKLRASDDLDFTRVATEYLPWVSAMVDAYRVLRLRPLLAEEPLYDPQYQFAGTLDFFGWAPELAPPPAICLIDWKTGDFSSADMQLGALAQLLRANYPQIGGPIHAYVIALSADGRWSAHEMDPEEGWQDFAAARRLYARRRRNGNHNNARR